MKNNFCSCVHHAQLQQSDVSRRNFLVITAGSVAGVATSSLSLPAFAGEREDEDEVVAAARPIPGGVLVGPPNISLPPVFIALSVHRRRHTVSRSISDDRL